jgi:type VI secretion system protein ImpI
MLLTLSVISAQGASLGAASYRVFDSRGGTIGRVAGNDWVLPDAERLVSSRHACVRCIEGRFYVEDVSTNGTALNARQAVIPRGRPQLLNDGDRLYVGDYEILVQLLADAGPEPIPAKVAAVPPLMPRVEPVAHGGGLLDDLLAGETFPSVSGAMPSALPNPVLGSGLPDHWDNTGFTPQRAPPVAPAASHPSPPAPVLSAAAPHSAGQDIDTLLASLGLTAQQVPPETTAQLGQILRIVVQGLMDVLAARKQVKDHFRMAMTIIRPVENNPLKFAPTPEEATYTLFVKRNPGYLGPIEAFSEAFDDLSFHQLAVLAGMRAAFFATLQRFNPEALTMAAEKAGGKKAAGLFGGGKGAYWDYFRQQYERLTSDSEANFQQIFGEAFVRAYDDQIRKLQDVQSRRP